MQYRWYVWEKHPPGRRTRGPYAIAPRQDGHRRSVFMHKLITGWALTDHINHDGLDNQRSNLRPATNTQNQANQRPRLGNSSRFKGVSRGRRDGKWRATIKSGKWCSLGYFGSEVDAARAYDRAALELFGEFACTNQSLGLLDDAA